MYLNRAKFPCFFAFLIFFNIFTFSILARNFSDNEYDFQVGSYGGKLILATISDPKSFNPIVAKETSTTAITGYLFEGLTTTDGITLEVEPNLAKSWDVSENGKEWVFYLRKDVKWFDGEQFTADDVVFTFNDLIYNPDIPTSARDIFTIEGRKFKVEKLGKFKVKFTLPVVFAPFLRGMSQEILPEHLLRKVVEEGKFNSCWGLGAGPENIIGTGPFKLKKYIPGERIILVRNSNYWQKDPEGNTLPYLGEIVYRIVQNQDVSLLKFREGELDYYGVRGQDYPILKPEEDKGDFDIYKAGPELSSNFLVFNQNRGISPKTGNPYVSSEKLSWFTDVRFRRAVAYAIDREAIINILMNGLGVSQYSSVSPSAGFFYNPDVVKYPYNINKARELLRDMGIYDRDKDGIAEDKQGNKIQFNLFTNANRPIRIKIANIVREDLSRLAFNVNFIPLEFNQLVAKLDSTFDWDAILIGLTGGIEPHFGNNVWQSSGHLHMWFPRQKKPATGWEARIDEIFNKAVQTLNKKERKNLYDEWQMIVSKKVPMIYTALPLNIFAIRNKFGNLHPTPVGGAFHNIEEIYVLDREDAHR